MNIKDIKVGDRVKWTHYFINGNGEIEKKNFQGKVEGILSGELDCPISVRKEGETDSEPSVQLPPEHLSPLD